MPSCSSQPWGPSCICPGTILRPAHKLPSTSRTFPCSCSACSYDPLCPFELTFHKATYSHHSAHTICAHTTKAYITHAHITCAHTTRAYSTHAHTTHAHTIQAHHMCSHTTCAHTTYANTPKAHTTRCSYHTCLHHTCSQHTGTHYTCSRHTEACLPVPPAPGGCVCHHGPPATPKVGHLLSSFYSTHVRRFFPRTVFSVS